MPHHAQLGALGGVLVQAQDQRADGTLRLARAPADDYRVDRADALDLRHPLALAGEVRRSPLLGDRPLGVREPFARVPRVLGGLHQLDRSRAETVAGEQPLQGGATLRERTLEQRVLGLGEQVEGDVHRGRLGGETRNARGGGMDALTQRVEVLAPVAAAHDDLAVEHVAAGREA